MTRSVRPPTVRDVVGKLDAALGPRNITRLRNQMRRLFNAHVQLVYEDERGEASVSSSVADRTDFWWNERKPDERVLWDSKIRLGEDFFNEIIHGPQTLRPGSRSLPLAHLSHLRTHAPATAHLTSGIPAVRLAPGQAQRQTHRSKLPP